MAQAADQIIVISEGLKQELIKRGICEDKIEIVPNGVDCKQFYPSPCNEKIANQLEVQDKFVIGYIGSIVKYEGLQNIILALQLLKEKGIKDIKFIIAGDGNYKNELEKMTQELALQDTVIFTGRIEHTEVINYYSIFDLCIFPREEEEVTQMVTPLKPLEAMACGKAVIGANLQAIKEMIINQVNGIIFDNTIEDLAIKIEEFINVQKSIADYKEKGRTWVETNRDWNVLTYKYKEIYMKLEKELISDKKVG